MESTEIMTVAEPVSSGAFITRLPIADIAKRLAVGKMAVYEMLEKGILPGIRLGRRWIVTRQAFEQWERTCGIGSQNTA
jgi:excisionase family DNA binding protein